MLAVQVEQFMRLLDLLRRLRTPRLSTWTLIFDIFRNRSMDMAGGARPGEGKGSLHQA
jgi:hypothetical protein